MTGLSLRILAGLAFGLFAGAALAGNSTSEMFLIVLQPIGKLWLDALTMTVVPLVFSLLVTGIVSATSSGGGGRTAWRALMWFAIMLVSACLVSAAFTTVALNFWPVSTEAASLRSLSGMSPELAPTGDWLANIIPTNPLKAASDTAMVPLVIFAVLFGFAVGNIDAELKISILTFFKAVVQAMLVIVHRVLLIAPLGVFALAFSVGTQVGASAAGALLQYVVFAVSSCLVTATLSYIVATLLGRMSPFTFSRAALPAQIVATSTQSSLASLPAMINAADVLGVGKEEAGIVLPLAVSIFRAASAAANVTVAIYLAHVHDVTITPGTLIIGSLVAAAVSIAAVGLPAQVSFFAIIGPVCIAMNVPIGLLPLLLAVETIPDIFRTLGNVTADLAVTRVVAQIRRNRFLPYIMDSGRG